MRQRGNTEGFPSGSLGQINQVPVRSGKCPTSSTKCGKDGNTLNLLTVCLLDAHTSVDEGSGTCDKEHWMT